MEREVKKKVSVSQLRAAEAIRSKLDIATN